MKHRRQKFLYRVHARCYARACALGLDSLEQHPDATLTPVQRDYWQRYYALNRAVGDCHKNYRRPVLRQARAFERVSLQLAG